MSVAEGTGMRSICVFVLAAVLAGCGPDPGPGEPGEPSEPDAAVAPWQPEAVTIVADGESFPNGIVSDGATAWWVSTPGIGANTVSIRALDLASGEVSELSTIFGSATFLRADGDELFVGGDQVTGAIRAIAKSSGATREVITEAERIVHFDVDDERVYWVSGVALRSARKDGSDRRDLATLSGSATGLVVDDARLYVLTVEGVEVVGKTGGTPALLLDLQIGASGNLAADDDFVYVSDRSTPAAGRIIKIPKDGAQGSSTQIASNQLTPGRMVSDGEYLYWVNRPTDSAGAVMRVALDGSLPELVADGLEVPADVVLTAGAVLWTVNGREPSGGAIMAAPR